MRIGIDASRAFIRNRTGIEEYSYQVIKSLAYRQAGLMNKLEGHRVVLYIRKSQISNLKSQISLPEDWRVKVIHFPYLWTQIGLSLEMLLHPVDVLFIPAHTVPCIHPKNTFVTIHGLEYEFCPKAYSFWERIYMRCVIKNSCQWTKKIIAVSENTKKDLMNLYKVPEEKIEVIYEGCNYYVIARSETTKQSNNSEERLLRFARNDGDFYLLFIGRLEERKNISGIIEAFEILKEKYKIPHKLVLAGKPGFGFTKARNKIQDSRYKNDILLKGFVKDDKKENLLKNADVFLFPSFYEGFGLPVLEAQAAGVPVVTSNVSSLPEVADSSAILVDPKKPEEIAEAAYKLISDENFRNDIINRGFENIKRFSWDKCAEEIAELLKA
jgi:glycosyltransferase involved in cell wall biosynthesis